MNKLFDYIIILILFFILAFFPWFYGSVGLRERYVIHLLALAFLFLWLIKKGMSLREIEYQPLYLPLFSLLLIAASSILFSIYRYPSILEFLNFLSYAIIFFIITQVVNSDKRLNLFVWVINLIGLFYCSYGVLQYYGNLAKTFWTEQYSLSSRFINSGPFAAFININIFLSLGVILASKKIMLRIIYTLFLVLFFISLILSKSRISWLVFLITIIFFATLTLRKIHLTTLRRLIFIMIFATISGCIILYYKTSIWERLQVAVPTQFQSLRQRFDVWIGAMKIILNHPFGTGIGTFQYIYPVYRIHSDRFLVDYAHSDFLQIAAELGIIGIALFICFVVGLFRQVFKKISGNISKQDYFIIIGLMSALLAFILQSLVDFPLHIPANAILFFMIMALLMRRVSFDMKKITLNKNISWFIMSAMIIFALLFTNIYLAREYYLLGRKALSRMDWQEALINFNRSIKLFSLSADTYETQGSIYALKATLAFSPQEKTECRKRARSDFLKATRLNPYQTNSYLNLAWLYRDEGQDKEAISVFHKAIETNPTKGAPYYYYANYCLEHNLLSEALSSYRKALSLFSDEDTLNKLYKGAYFGLFKKIYAVTQDYNELKIVMSGNNLEAHIVFAEFLEDKNMLSESYAEYKKILKRYPDNQIAKGALERLGKR